MAKYRPIKNPYHSDQCSDNLNPQANIWDEACDALLEALRKKGTHFNDGIIIFEGPVMEIKVPGCLIFIPDDIPVPVPHVGDRIALPDGDKYEP